MVTAVEAELTKLTKVKKRVTETASAYRMRLAQAVLELPDTTWESLSTDAQVWTNDTIRSKNEGEDGPDFPGVGKKDVATDGEAVEAPEKKESEASAESEPETKKDPGAKAEKGVTAKKKKKPAPKVEAPKKTEVPKKKQAPVRHKEVKAKAGRKARADGPQTALKKLVLKNPEIELDDLVQQLHKAGFEVTRGAAASIRSGFRHSMRVIREAGMMKGTPK